MKRTFPFIVLQALMFLFTVLMFLFDNQALVYVIFFIDIILLIQLIREPHWKIAALVVFFVFIENMALVINYLILDIFVDYHLYLNLFVLFLGIQVSWMAEWMKKYLVHPFPHGRGEDMLYEEFSADNPINEENNLPDESENINPDEDIEFQTYINILNTDDVHLEGCELLEDVDDEDMIIIGSKKYAMEKFKPCRVCKPFE